MKRDRFRVRSRMCLAVWIGGGVLSASTAASDFIRVGLSLKTDIPNEIIAPAGRIVFYDSVMLDVYPVGWISEYEGFGLRLVGLVPPQVTSSGIAWRPYVGVGFAQIERDITVYLPKHRAWGHVFDVAPVTAQGRGGQVVGGIQLFPLRSTPRLALEMEAFYSFFTVDAEVRIRVEGAEPFLGDPPVVVLGAQADYKAFGFGIGLALLFW